MRKLLVTFILLGASAPVLAKSLNVNSASCAVPSSGKTCQAAFDAMSEDLVAAIDYKALGPAASTGVVSLGVGLVLDYVPVKNSSEWKQVTNTDISGLGEVGVQVTKGLPFDIDIGAFYTTVPSTDVKLYGGEVRYAILAGGVAEPALAVRGSYVTLTGLDNFKADSKALDVSLSKGFPFLTPYAGVGYVWGTADPDASTTLNKAEVNKTKAYAGLRLSMGLFEVTPEVSEIGKNIAYALRAGFSFSL